MTSDRRLSKEEHNLVRWMLEHGKPEAASFLSQLEQALVSSWRCPCGCASLNFAVPGLPKPQGGLNVLGDFLFGSQSELSGVFVYEQAGVLSGLEVYGLAGDAPKALPSTASLRQFSDA